MSIAENNFFFSHARKRPPLPLRFAIYRKNLGDLNKEASSQHPFFLYSLKECLISAVADDFGLRHELDRNKLWSEFEARVVECCDRMIRPYSCIAPVVSARMLLSRKFSVFFKTLFFFNFHIFFQREREQRFLLMLLPLRQKRYK